MKILFLNLKKSEKIIKNFGKKMLKLKLKKLKFFGEKIVKKIREKAGNKILKEKKQKKNKTGVFSSFPMPFW